MAKTRHAPLWISSGEAARRLGVCHQTIYRFAEQGRITTLKLPGIRAPRFKVADIDTMVTEGTIPALIGRGAGTGVEAATV